MRRRVWPKCRNLEKCRVGVFNLGIGWCHLGCEKEREGGGIRSDSSGPLLSGRRKKKTGKEVQEDVRSQLGEPREGGAMIGMGSRGNWRERMRDSRMTVSYLDSTNSGHFLYPSSCFRDSSVEEKRPKSNLCGSDILTGRHRLWLVSMWIAQSMKQIPAGKLIK